MEEKYIAVFNKSCEIAREFIEKNYPDEAPFFDTFRKVFDWRIKEWKDLAPEQWGLGADEWKAAENLGFSDSEALDLVTPIIISTVTATLFDENVQQKRLSSKELKARIESYARQFGALGHLSARLVEAVPDLIGIFHNGKVRKEIERQQQVEASFSEKSTRKRVITESEPERVMKEIKKIEDIKRDDPYHKIIGKSRAIRKLIEDIDKARDTDATVLITGETGVGKELIARAIHEKTESRKDGIFQPVNIASISENISESELFGHDKGAFTGAHKDKKGFFENANGGTIFLDEIGELNNQCQVKILRVLQEKEIVHVGGTKVIPVDVRIIAATNKILENSVKDGTFREDLFYRLDVFRIRVPSLRERKEDIPMLTQHFVSLHCDDMNRKKLDITEEAMKKLLLHDWPGNVRELGNCIMRAVIKARGDVIDERDIVFSDVRKLESESFSLHENERDLILKALNTSRKVKEAYKKVGLPKATFHKKCNELGIINPRNHIQKF